MNRGWYIDRYERKVIARYECRQIHRYEQTETWLFRYEKTKTDKFEETKIVKNSVMYQMYSWPFISDSTSDCTQSYIENYTMPK